MNKIIFAIGFLIPISAYFNDQIAEYVQGIGGVFWGFFYRFGIFMYPIYLLIFILPIFLIISIIISRVKAELRMKKTFLVLLYGFFVSSGIFLLFSIIAVSQFHFTQ